VGRIAFWADDETCKVNINTAAEGTYWDTPRFTSSQLAFQTSINTTDALQYPEYAFGSFMPAQFEFQRYPGHPAQVALSSVFPSITTQSATSLTPRLVWGGSQGGTLAPRTTAAAPVIDLRNAPRKALYTTVDEYLFSGNYSGSNRLANNAGSTLSKNDLESAKFFITANSRAPEVNLYNLPRIACWPVDVNTSLSANRTTAFDRLIAFSSSIASSTNATARLPYYFQRQDSRSATNDYTNIQRNKDLYSYLQRLTGAAVPGFGGNFLRNTARTATRFSPRFSTTSAARISWNPIFPGIPLLPTRRLEVPPIGQKQ
jgi:hypothetical protein